MDYHEAVNDAWVYAGWLHSTYPSGELADRLVATLHDAGLTVPKTLADGLDGANIDWFLLTTVIAQNNVPSEDTEFQRYCEQTYGTPDDHPSMTVGERNRQTRWSLP